ncbi:MAG: FecR domain-containing protein [Cyclobacteriaceae bacterium]
MDDWDKKLNQKLADYQYGEDPSEEQVSLFFDQMDKKNTQGSFHWSLKIAAAVALLVGVFFLSYQFSETTIALLDDQREMVILPDNSTVALNENSTLSYNKMSWLWKRSVELEGEGFFEVEKGNAFVVISQNGSTEVLGTSFNINTRKDRYAVKCYTGKVKVTANEQQQILKPGQAVAVTTSEIVEQYNFDAKNAASWQTGEYQFDNQDIGVVLMELSQTYGIHVQANDSIKKMKYSGYFPVDNLDLSLKLICDPLDLTYEQKGEEIIIRTMK